MTSIPAGYLPPSFYNQNGDLAVPEDQAQAAYLDIKTKADAMPPAEAKLFLAMIQASDISPDSVSVSGGTPDTRTLDEQLQVLEVAAGALSSLSDGTIDVLARALIEQAAQQRKDALVNRLEAREAARTDLLNQASQLHKEAADMKEGALISMVVSVVMAAVSIAMSAVATFKTASAMKASNEQMTVKTNAEDVETSMKNRMNTGEKLTPNELETLGDVRTTMNESQIKLNNLSTSQQKMMFVNNTSQALNQMGQGVSGGINSYYQGLAKDEEAEGSIYAADAQYLEGQADIKKEAQQALDDMIKSIINFLKELKETQVDMMKAITRS